MKKLSITLTYAALLLISFFSAMQAAAFDPNSIGIVDNIQGEVYAHSHTGEKRQLSRNAPIYEGETIETIDNGAVVVVFKDGTQWDIYDESKLSILKYHFTEDSQGSPNDGAIFQIHTGELTYFSGDMGKRSAPIEIKLSEASIHPQGTRIEFVTVRMTISGQTKTVTVGTMVEGTAEIVKNGQPTGKTIEQGQWFIKDSYGNIVRMNNAKQAIQATRDVLRHAMSSSLTSTTIPKTVQRIIANQLSRAFARISVALVRAGYGIEVDKDEAGEDLLEDTPALGGSSTLFVASPNQ